MGGGSQTGGGDICQIILQQMENFNVDEGNEGERDGAKIPKQVDLVWELREGSLGSGCMSQDVKEERQSVVKKGEKRSGAEGTAGTSIALSTLMEDISLRYSSWCFCLTENNLENETELYFV